MAVEPLSPELGRCIWHLRAMERLDALRASGSQLLAGLQERVAREGVFPAGPVREEAAGVDMPR